MVLVNSTPYKLPLIKDVFFTLYTIVHQFITFLKPFTQLPIGLTHH